MTSRRVLACILLVACSAAAQTVRIGVLSLFHPKNLVITPAERALVMEIGQRSVVLTQAARVRVSGKEIQVSSAGSTWRGERLIVHDRANSFAELTLSIPGKLRRSYRGSLEVVAGAGELVPVMTMDQEVAVASIVAVESPPGAPLEALKALAVAARSFLAARASGHIRFDFCDSTHCQHLRQPPAENSPASQATLATRGLVLAFHDAVFAAMYTPACGGRTRSLAELRLPMRDYPYFSVECPYCREHPRHWVRELPRPLGGERERLAFVRQQGWSALPGNNYQVQEIDGRLIARGSGLGHGLGLCERGAAAMAAEGKSFRDILNHYYPNASITSQPD